MRSLAFILAVPAVVSAIAGTRAFAAPVAYITNFEDDTVSVLDTATETVTATVPVGADPYGVAVGPDGRRVYVANVEDATVSVLDTATNTIVDTVPVGASPAGIAVDPAGTRAYVANSDAGTVSVLDTATNTIVATVAVGASPSGVAVSPAGTRVYVANACGTDSGCNSFDGLVSVIDTATNAVVATVPVGASPVGVAVAPAGERVYVANRCGTDVSCAFGGGTVSAIDTTTNTVVATIAVGQGPVAFGSFIAPVTTTSTTTPFPPTSTSTTGIPAPTPTTPPCNGPRCVLGAALRSPACVGQAVPSRLATRFDRATRLVERATSVTPRQARKLLKQARKALRQGASAATTAANAKRLHIASACAAALADAAGRVAAGLPK